MCFDSLIYSTCFNFTMDIETRGRKFRMYSGFFNPPPFVSFPFIVKVFRDTENETKSDEDSIRYPELKNKILIPEFDKSGIF